MKPRLVYLHIPKSAGTSECQKFESIYGKDRVFWWPRREYSVAEKTIRKDSDHWMVVGAHTPVSGYPTNRLSLYVSIVRDPVSRVLSLFNYFTRPELGVTPSDIKERQRQKKQWLEEGVDPESITRSIKHCNRFRAMVENEQCRYLSRGGATFHSALETMKKENFIVGTFDNVKLLNLTLSELLEWPDKTSEFNTNRSVLQADNRLASDDEAIELIQSITSEDFKLYSFIKNDCSNLFCNILEKDALRFYLSSGKHTSTHSFHHWSDITLSSEKKIRVSKKDKSIANILITNDSNLPLNPLEGKGLFISYHILSSNGSRLEYKYLHTPIYRVIPSKGYLEVEAQIHIPERVFELASSIEVSIICADEYWVDSINNKHGTRISIEKIN